RRRHTRSLRDWSSDVCSSDLPLDLRGVERTAGNIEPFAIEIDLEGGAIDGAEDGRERGAGPVADAVVHEVDRLSRPQLRHDARRSEERRVGKEWRSRMAADC